MNTPAHFPANPVKFEFDGAVAEIFDNMADRSIPLFRESHLHNARVAAPWIASGHASILDVGASRGAFIRALDQCYGIENLEVRATDVSAAMVAFMSQDFPSVTVEQVDITTRGFLNCLHTYDVINFTYVLQFIPKELQRIVLSKVCAMVKPGGVLFVGQKNKDESPAGKIIHDQYIQWRLDNGYTLDEIEAKTKALAGSMWPMDEAILVADLKSSGMVEVVRTCAWGPFSNLMCIKR